MVVLPAPVAPDEGPPLRPLRRVNETSRSTQSTSGSPGWQPAGAL